MQPLLKISNGFYNQAYPAERDERLEVGDMEQDITLAEWQGVRYPDYWDAQQWRLLLQSLEEVDLHDLVWKLEQAL